MGIRSFLRLECGRAEKSQRQPKVVLSRAEEVTGHRVPAVKCTTTSPSSRPGEAQVLESGLAGGESRCRCAADDRSVVYGYPRVLIQMRDARRTSDTLHRYVSVYVGEAQMADVDHVHMYADARVPVRGPLTEGCAGGEPR